MLRFVLLFICIFGCKSIPHNSNFGGLALYTVRAEMQNDPTKTLKTVAEIGYAYIEDAGYADGKFYGLSPEKYKAELAKKNLIARSTHQSGITQANANQIIEDAKKVGFEYLVIPVPLNNYYADSQTHKPEFDPIELSKILNELGEKCHAKGIKLLYHNHDFEFEKLENGQTKFEILLENTHPKWVNFELDLYWVVKAGENPIDYLQRYPGRFKIRHVKDMVADGNFAPVGKGKIDFAEILRHKEKSGMQYYFVEQDKTYDLPALEAVKISHDALRGFGFD